MYASDVCLPNRNFLQVVFSPRQFYLIFLMLIHFLKTSPTRNLIITDSQGRNLTFPTFNILVLPGARVGDVRPFLPAKSRYDLIVLFIGGNDLPTDNTQNVARNISDLAVPASEVALRVFVITVPPRQDIPDPAKAVNRFLEGNNDRGWLYRRISRCIYSVEKHTIRDDIHLEARAISGTRSILRIECFGKPSAPRLTNKVFPQHTSAVDVIAPARAKSRKMSSGKRLPHCGYYGTFLSSIVYARYSLFCLP